MDAKAQSYSSNTNWLILVDTSRCVTSIYTGAWNNWSLNRRYVCSTGKASTPTVIGEYQVYGKGYSFGHGYTCYYYTQFYGDYLFHSSPYYINSNRVMDPTMGVPSSAGCVRLEIQNAKWIYDNIPYGTKVVTYWLFGWCNYFRLIGLTVRDRMKILLWERGPSARLMKGIRPRIWYMHDNALMRQKEWNVGKSLFQFYQCGLHAIN